MNKKEQEERIAREQSIYVKTQMNSSEEIKCVLHSTLDGHDDDDDPRIMAANGAMVQYELEFGLPKGVAWCEGAVGEVLARRNGRF